MVGRRGPQQGELFVYLPEAPATQAREELRALAQVLDFEPVRELVAPYFAGAGKPSVDPVLLSKMLLLGALFGIGSRRELCDECADRLSFREFLGLALSEAVPVHSNFTNWAGRVGAEVFGDLLHGLVRQCQALGMAISVVRSVDATLVKAQAGEQGPQVAVERAEVAAYVAALLSDPATPGPGAKPADPVVLSRHDPEARLQRKGGQPAQFGYQVSLSSDPASGLVMDVVVTGLEEAGTLAKHVAADPVGGVAEVVADSFYDRGEALAAVQALGVRTYVPEKTKRMRQIHKEAFVWDAAADVYYGPAGQVLRRKGGPNAAGETQYRAAASACAGCSRKAWCTTGVARTITRCAGEEARERTVRRGARYARRMAARQVAEHLNLLAKRDHGLRRAMGVGRVAVTIQAVFVAMAINANKLLRHLQRGPRKAVATSLRDVAQDLRRAVGWSLGPSVSRSGRWMAPADHAETPAPTGRPWRPSNLMLVLLPTRAI